LRSLKEEDFDGRNEIKAIDDIPTSATYDFGMLSSLESHQYKLGDESTLNAVLELLRVL
jgi:hypothetical protein